MSCRFFVLQGRWPALFKAVQQAPHV